MEPKRPQKKGIKFSIFWMYAVILLILGGIYFADNDNTVSKENVEYNKFEQYVMSGGVTKIVVYTGEDPSAAAFLNDSLAKVVFKKQFSPGQQPIVTTNIPSADSFQSKIDQWQQDGYFKGSVKYEKSSNISYNDMVDSAVCIAYCLLVLYNEAYVGKRRRFGRSIFSW